MQPRCLCQSVPKAPGPRSYGGCEDAGVYSGIMR